MRNSVKNIKKHKKRLGLIDIVDSRRLMDVEQDVKPNYWGFDKDGEEWCGERANYLSDNECVIDEYSVSILNNNDVLNEDGQRVEIIIKDQTYKTEVGRDYELFNSNKFKNALAHGIVHFVYKKVNGKEREAFGTTNMNILIKNHCRMLVDRRKYKTNNIRYYDMYSKGWRSFRPNNLVKIYQEVDMSQAN